MYVRKDCWEIEKKPAGIQHLLAQQTDTSYDHVHSTKKDIRLDEKYKKG